MNTDQTTLTGNLGISGTRGFRTFRSVIPLVFAAFLLRTRVATWRYPIFYPLKACYFVAVSFALILNAVPARAAVGGSPFYEFKVVARNESVVHGLVGEFPLSSIEPEVSINDNGRVVFTGKLQRPTGIASAVVVEEPATGNLYWINRLAFSGDDPPNPFSYLTFLDPQIINDGTVVVSELTDGNVRIMNGYQAGEPGGDQNVPPWITVQYSLRENDVGLTVDKSQGSLSEDGLVSLVVTKWDSTRTVAGPHWLDVAQPGVINTEFRVGRPLVGPTDAFFGTAYPAAGLGGATIVKSGQGMEGEILYYNGVTVRQPPLASTLTPSNPRWQALGAKPGITSDGKVVAFVGRDANGVEGIFIQVFDSVASQAAPVPVITTASVIGMDENENPIHFSSFDFANRTPIVRHDAGNNGAILDDSLIISFIATPGSESILNRAPRANLKPLLFSSGKGIWTIKVDIQEALGDPGIFVANTSGPFPVIQVGDKIDGQAIEQLYLWDGLGLGFREFDGADRRTSNLRPTPRDHLLAFVAHTPGGNVVIKAAHMDTDGDGLLDHWERSNGGIDMDRDGIPELNLALMGAFDTHKDLFLEIDWLPPRPNNVGFPFGWSNEPQPGALRALAAMFNDEGITLHVDAGAGKDLTGEKFSQNMPASANLDGGQHVALTARPDFVVMSPTGDPRVYPSVKDGTTYEHFQNLKEYFFGRQDKSARELAFRYCILGDFLEFTGRSLDDLPILAATRHEIRIAGSDTSMVCLNLTRPKPIGQIVVRSGVAIGQTRKCLASWNSANTELILQIKPPFNSAPSSGDLVSIVDGISGIAETLFRSRRIGEVAALNGSTDFNFHTLPGNDFFVALGVLGWSDNGLLGNPTEQWQTIAHELGHTLGLLHGGKIPDCSYSGDRHWSLMSYSHQLRTTGSDKITIGGECRNYPDLTHPYLDTCPNSLGRQSGLYYSAITESGDPFMQPPINGRVTLKGNDPLGFNEWSFIKFENWSAPWHLGNTFLKYRGTVPNEPQSPIDFASTDADRISPVILLVAPIPPNSVPFGGTLVVAGRVVEQSGLVGVTVSLDVNNDGAITAPGEVINPSLGPSNTFSLSFTGFTGSAGIRQLRIKAEDLSGNIGFLNLNIMVGGPVPDTRGHFINLIKPVLPADLRPIVRMGDWFEVQVLAYDYPPGSLPIPTNSGTMMFTFDINGDGMTNGPGEVIVAHAAISNLFQVFFPNLSGPPGNRTLRFVSTDEWLNRSELFTVTVVVLEDESIPPTLSFVTPAENFTAANGAVLNVVVMARDTNGVKEVLARFDVDGDGDAEVFQLYPWTVDQFQGGTGAGIVGSGGLRPLTVTATDRLGNTTNITRTVAVAPPPLPLPYIVLPTEGSPVRTGGTLTVEVDATNATAVTVFFDRDGNGQTNDVGEVVSATALSSRRHRAVFSGVAGPTGPRVITAVARSASQEFNTGFRRVNVTEAFVAYGPEPGERVPQSSTFTVQLGLVAEGDSSSAVVRFDINGDGDTDDPGETVRPFAQPAGRSVASFSNISGPPGERLVRGEAGMSGGGVGTIAVPVTVTDGGSYAGSRSEKLAAVPQAAVPAAPDYFSSVPDQFTVAGNQLFFTATTPQTGRELWRTDGTRRGTSLLRDIRPGFIYTSFGSQRASSGAHSLVSFQGKLFFGAIDGLRSYFRSTYGGYGWEMWSSDGTSAGTTLFKDIRPIGYRIDPDGLYESSYAGGFIEFNNRLFFKAEDGILNSDVSPHGYELWSSDGTSGGTSLFKDVKPGSANGIGSPLFVVGNAFYFTDYFKKQLWKSDGTVPGTVLVKDLAPAGSLRSFTSARGLLFFVASAQGANPSQVWRSDGTLAGTFMLRAFPHTGTDSTTLRMSGALTNHLLLGVDDGLHGVELWKSDGTTGGTVLVKDISPGSPSSVPVEFAAYDGMVYFSADDGTHGRELWRTDGTEAGTRMVINLAESESLPAHDLYPIAHSVPESLTVFNGKLYFCADSGEGILGRELWRTDGTAEGTELVKDLAPGMRLPSPGLLIDGLPNSSWPTDFHVFDGRLYFTAWDPIYLDELWTSDGTAAGTHRVRNLSLAAGSPIVPLPGGVVFTASDLMNKALWSSAPAGTMVLTNVASGAVDSTVTHLMTIGGKALFAVATASENRLYVTDGTIQNTRKLATIPPSIQAAALGNWMLFSGTDASGRELWRTDGTTGGTVLVKDINPGPGDSSPAIFFRLNGQLYFQASDPSAGTELWRTDGTAEGTLRVADINAGAASSNPKAWSALGNRLVFWADDGAHGREPWVMDGSSGITRLLQDIRIGPTSSDRLQGLGSAETNVEPRAVLNGVLYFRAEDGINGREMWRTDGTSEGTKMVSRLGFNTSGSDPGQYTVMADKIFFSTEFGTSGGAGLWKTDGTSNGTMRIRQFYQKTASGGYLPASTPQSFLALNELLYFQAADDYGWELWRSDGTTNGTFLLKDIMPGLNSPEISEMTAIDGELYFVATDEAHGRELWKSDGTSDGTQLVEDLLPGPESSNPQFLATEGNALYYFANDGGDDLSLRRLTSEMPILTIALVERQVIISWPLPATGYLLGEAPMLAPAASWTPVSLPYVTNTTHISVTVPMPVANNFYRLHQ